MVEHETVEFGCRLTSEVFRTDGFYVRLTLNVKTEELMKMEV